MGFIELYETTFKSEYLQQAIDLSSKMFEDFMMETAEGFSLEHMMRKN